jgi:hypothetical protein
MFAICNVDELMPNSSRQAQPHKDETTVTIREDHTFQAGPSLQRQVYFIGGV